MRGQGLTRVRLLLGTILLVGCVGGASPGGISPSPIPTRPTATPPPATRTAAPSPTVLLPTIPPRPTAPSPTAPAACRRPIVNTATSEAPIPLPDLAGRRWTPLPMPGQKIRQLPDLGYPAFPITLSPNGRWLEVALEYEPRVFYPTAAIALLDTQDAQHEWLSAKTAFHPEGYFRPHFYPVPLWLPDGRRLWGEGEQIFVGDPRRPRVLTPPEPMSWIRYATGDIAFARNAAGDLWRVDLRTGRWEKVPNPRPPRNGALGTFFALAWDGSYGLALTWEEASQDSLRQRPWRVPARMGAPAEPLPDFIVTPVGVGMIRGAPSVPTVELRRSPYWVIGLPIWVAKRINAEGFVVDLRTGHVLTAADLGLPPDHILGDFSVSPGGAWLAIDISRPRDPASRALYLAPSENLRAGRTLPGMWVVAWHLDPPAVILKDRASGRLSVLPLPPPPDSEGIPLPEARPPLATLPGGLVAVDARAPARLLRFDLSGRLVEALDLSEWLGEIVAVRGVLDLRVHDWVRGSVKGATNRIFISGVGRTPKPEGTCEYILLEWTLEP